MNIRTKKIKTLKGFSVAEAMVALIITIFCIEILTGILGIMKTADKKKPPVNEVAFSYVQLNEFIKDEGQVEIDPKNSNSKQIILKKLVSVTDEKPLFKSYSIEQYKSMIRMKGVNGGHMPLFLNVKSAKFSTKETSFEIDVTENDGRLSQLSFQTDKPFKIEKEDVSKNKEHEIKKDKINEKKS